MKRILSITLAALLALSLAACAGESSTDQSSSQPTVSESGADNSSPEPSGTEEDTPEQDLPPEEDEEAEEEAAEAPVMVGGENSISVVVGEETVATFTLPTETPIYTKLKYLESDKLAMMTHNVMEGVSGRTIIEVTAGSCQDYAGSFKSHIGIDADAEPEIRDLNGREVLVYKQAEQVTNNLGDEIYDLGYLVAVPVTETATLGFRIDASYSTDNAIVFDDSVIDILLSHLAF